MARSGRWSSLLLVLVACGSILGCETIGAISILQVGESGSSPEEKAESKGLQGTWQFVYIETVGQALNEHADEQWTFDGDLLTQKIGDKKKTMTFRVIDVGTKPKKIDFIDAETGERISRELFPTMFESYLRLREQVPGDFEFELPEFPPAVLPGIYRKSGDRLEICLSVNELKRPKEFARTPNSPFILYRLDRINP